MVCDQSLDWLKERCNKKNGVVVPSLNMYIVAGVRVFFYTCACMRVYVLLCIGLYPCCVASLRCESSNCIYFVPYLSET